MVRWVVGSILHGGPIELFLSVFGGFVLMEHDVAHGAMGHWIDPSWWTH